MDLDIEEVIKLLRQLQEKDGELVRIDYAPLYVYDRSMSRQVEAKVELRVDIMMPITKPKSNELKAISG